MLRSRDDYLRRLPSVDAVLRDSSSVPIIEECGRDLVVGWIRGILHELRESMPPENADILQEAINRLRRAANSLKAHAIRAVGVCLFLAGRLLFSDGKRPAARKLTA